MSKKKYQWQWNRQTPNPFTVGGLSTQPYPIVPSSARSRRRKRRRRGKLIALTLLLLLILSLLLYALTHMGSSPHAHPHVTPAYTTQVMLHTYTSYPTPSDELLPPCPFVASSSLTPRVEGTGSALVHVKDIEREIEQFSFSAHVYVLARTPYATLPSFEVHEAILFHPLECSLFLVVDVSHGWCVVLSGPTSPLVYLHRDAAQGVFMQEYRRTRGNLTYAIEQTLLCLREDFLWSSPFREYAFE